MTTSLASLALPVPPIEAEVLCLTLYERFTAEPDTLSLAVVEDGRPVGLVNRHEFLHSMAHRYGRALYDRQPITALMDREPLIVDVSVTLEALNRQIVDEKPSALLKGFIVTHHGRYVGVGTAFSLLQFTVAHMRERARELETARQTAEHASAAKSQFLANMSHELRTPLNAVMGFSELIENETFGPLGDPNYREYAGLIRTSGEHLLSIINDVLDMSRIKAGKMALHEEAFDPREMIERCVRLLRNQAEAKSISLSIQVPGQLPDLFGDPLKLQQVLFNLLSNAIKFTPGDGAIFVRAAAPASGFVLAVVDTGIGIPEDQIPRVMEAFVQADTGNARQHGGSGLGLPLSKSLVEMHQGTLSIASTPEIGTTVTMRLPAERYAHASRDVEGAAPRPFLYAV